MYQDQVSITPTQSATTLQCVLDNFKHWRTNRVKRGKIPDDLMEQACSLVGHYPMTKITTELGLCFSKFRAYCINQGVIQPPFDKSSCKQPKTIGMQTHSQTTFVEVNTALQSVAQPMIDGSIQMTLRRNDGSSLEIALSQASAAADLMAQFLRD